MRRSPDPRATHEVTPAEREAFWEKLYAEPGFGIWQGNFRDILTDREANALISRSARHPRGDPGRARGFLGEAIRRARLRHLAGQFPRYPDRPRGQCADLQIGAPPTR